VIDQGIVDKAVSVEVEVVSVGLEQRLKSCDDLPDKIRELMERFEQRLTLDNLRLAERYIKAELHLLIHFGIRGVDKQFVASFQRAHHGIGLKEEMPSRGDGDGIVRNGLLGLPNQLLQASTCMGTEINTPEGGTDGNQHQAVFVDVVKFAEYPELVSLSSLVRFGCVDCVYGILPHALYLSIALGFVFRGVGPTDREVDKVFGGGLARSGQMKLVGQVVESTSKVLDHITSDEQDVCRHVLNTHDIVDQLSRLRIVLGPDSIWLGSEERLPCDIEISDVLFGPFDLEPSRKQLIRR